jgi:hypothetical protein
MINILLSTILVAATLEGLTITPSFDNAKWLAPHESIELRLSRPLDENEKLAVFIGKRDVTPLFDVSPSLLKYRTGVPPLPAGEQEIIVYAVTPSGPWEELGRFPMRVLTRRGFEKVNTKPSLDLTNKGQVAQDQNPPQSASSRDRFQDLTAQTGLVTELQRSDFTLRAQANATGVSYINEALRYGQKAENAPRYDLASYKVELQKGITSLAFGHVGFGNERHLINGFSSRGTVLTIGVGRPVSLALAAMNGTSIVGWDNILGFDEQQHRVYSATVGVELVPSRPGAARVEATLLNGSLLPLNAWTQNAVKSSEKSRGQALRVLLSDRNQRVTIDAGWARSHFIPQRDAELEDGLTVTPLSEPRRNARYVDVALALVRSRPIGKQSASLSASINYDRVDPLFRSVTASLQADYQRAAVTLNGNLGPLSMQFSQANSEDNLDDIRSILKSKTRQQTVNLGLSLASLFGARRGSRWIPTLTATASKTHQYGAFLPVNAGFSESHVPDQMSLNADTSLEWQLSKVRFGARGSYSNQDNRQPLRTAADFKSNATTVFVSLSPLSRIDLALEAARERQKNIENATQDDTNRYGITAAWRIIGELALAASYSETFGRDGARTNERRSSDSYAELSSGFKLWRSRQNQNSSRLFLRYSNRGSSTFDRVFNISNENDGWSLTSGVNVSVY